LLKKINFFRSLVFIALLSTAGCQEQSDYTRLSGFTMGTSYQITLKTNQQSADNIHQQIETELVQINRLMSTYIEDSELSILNQSDSLDCIKVSKQTFVVVKNALEISRQTNGRFDVTVGPLISEWGFDKKRTDDKIPSDQKIELLLAQTGFEKIILGPQCVQKQNATLSINLSAIAKGYGVDRIAAIIESNHVEDYLVEIGGETASKGLNPKSVHWRLAIEAPLQQQRQIQQVFSPLGLGVATSGDYRNYFENNGVRFSHTIDPTTGKPITHNLVSVTVLHPQTMLADAYATAFMVMGAEQSMAFANQHDLPIYLLLKNTNGFEAVYTKAFEKHLQ